MFTSLQERIAYLSHGGPVMVLLIISSLICLSLIIERWFALRREKILPQAFIHEVESLAAQKKQSEIVSLSRSHDNSVAHILVEGLSGNPQDREKRMEAAGKAEVMRLEKYLDLLGLLATLGPLMGLLGTVTGMINTFGVIEKVGVGDPLKLSAGIAEALLNTAGGLIVAIPAYIAQKLYYRKIDRYTFELERITQNVVNELK
ncbi:MAG: MotA/TolQ/ExbB proton channel family protein [Proteobacteria bacterium]|jgi:biopolymer transport protein ExbB|nr:MotA/TolQ/ExbB proton channel family protein [Pseudomonadota bacterium]